MPHIMPGGNKMKLDITSCPACWGTNLDPTEINPDHVVIVCHDCGQIFETQTTGTIANE